ncbi:MAG: DCC1-like thiol-disulfide oxidoreductase family protein [Pseudomonadota bacterium]
MRVADLSPALQDAVGKRDLIVFDGHCVLCSGFFAFMLRVDRTERFAFATAQGAVGQALYRELGLPTGDFETNLVVVDGVIHQRLGAFLAAMAAVGWPWRALTVLRLLPRGLQDAAYHRIARNRYRIFGRTEACLVPDASLRARFLDTLAPAPAA